LTSAVETPETIAYITKKKKKHAQGSGPPSNPLMRQRNIIIIIIIIIQRESTRRVHNAYITSYIVYDACCRYRFNNSSRRRVPLADCCNSTPRRNLHREQRIQFYSAARQLKTEKNWRRRPFRISSIRRLRSGGSESCISVYDVYIRIYTCTSEPKLARREGPRRPLLRRGRSPIKTDTKLAAVSWGWGRCSAGERRR